MANKGRSVRLWGVAIACACSWLVFVMALVAPDWIERCFGIDPDQATGGAEALIAYVAAIAAIASLAGARAEWRRARADLSTGAVV